MDVTEAERDEVKRKYAYLVGRHRTVVQEREALRSEIGEARAETDVMRSDVENAEIDREILKQSVVPDSDATLPSRSSPRPARSATRP